MTALTYAGPLLPVGLVDEDGNAQPNVPIEVLNLDGSPAAVYLDHDRAPVVGPVMSDVHGNVNGYYAEPGVYRLVFASRRGEPGEVVTAAPVAPEEILDLLEQLGTAGGDLAPLASPALTGTPTINGVTAETTAGAQAKATAAQTAAIAAAAADATAKVSGEATARAAAIASAISGLVNGAPGALDTLNELAARLQADETGAAALTAAVALRQLVQSRTTVKTSDYAAAPNDIVPVDTTSGPVAVTLPTAPADRTRVTVKLVVQGGSNAVTIACAGTDVLNKAGGGTTLTLSLLNQGVTLQYDAAAHVWTVLSDDLPLSQLATKAGPNVFTGTQDFTNAVVTGIAAGGGLTPTAVQTADYTAVAGDLVKASAASGLRTVTLPASAPAGTIVAVKKTDSSSNLVNVVTSDGATVEGGSSMNWAIQNLVRTFVKDRTGNNWSVAGGYITLGKGGVNLASVQPLNLANYQQGDGDQAAWNRLIVDWAAASGTKPEIVIPKGSYSFQSPIVMQNGMTITGEGYQDQFGFHVTITNQTTAMFDWPAGSSLVKGFVTRGISFSGQPTRAATASYTNPVFASSTKTLQYGGIYGCSFQFFTSFHCYFGGGTIRDCNFGHFNDVPLWLSGYDWTVDTNFLGVDTATTVGKFYPSPSPFVASATGGALSDGTYYVTTTAVIPLGESDITYPVAGGSTHTPIVLSAGTSTQSISFTTLASAAAPPGATGFNVYVSSTGVAGSFYRVNGATPVGLGANYTITSAPGSGTTPNPWVFPATTPLVRVENCPNFTLRDCFPTITSGGPGLHILNCISGGYVDSFKADGYDTLHTSAYGMNGAGVLIEGSSGVTLVGTRVHRAMGLSPTDGTGAVTFKNSSYISMVATLFLHQPAGTPNWGYIGTCTGIAIAGSVYQEAGTAGAAGIETLAAGASHPSLRWDEVGTPGPAGPTTYAPPTVWASGTTYTASGYPLPSVLRNGTWYGLKTSNTGQDPAADVSQTYWVPLAVAGPGTTTNYANAFGDGSDGAFVLDGTNTYGAFTKSGSTYTLARDLLATDVTLSAGVTVKSNGYLMQATGTVTVPSTAVISNDGGAGTAAGAAGAQPGVAGTYNTGGAGGAGNTGTGTVGNSGTVGGSVGGTGGTGSGGTGGANGAVASGSVQRLHNLWTMIAANMFNGGTNRAIGGGSGGGGGGGDGTNKGGGGGGAGGVVCIMAGTLVNNGTIRALGGAGGTPTTGNCGGGGGGGGGLVAVFTKALSGAGTFLATAGVGGSGVGTGTAGVTGTVGTVITSVVV